MKNIKPLLIKEFYIKKGISNSYLAEKEGITLKELYGLENNECKKAFVNRINRVV